MSIPIPVVIILVLWAIAAVYQLAGAIIIMVYNAIDETLDGVISMHDKIRANEPRQSTLYLFTTKLSISMAMLVNAILERSSLYIIAHSRKLTGTFTRITRYVKEAKVEYESGHKEQAARVLNDALQLVKQEINKL